MGPKTKLFLDTLLVGMNQAEKELIIAGDSFDRSIVFKVPAENKPDGMGVASVTETGIEMLWRKSVLESSVGATPERVRSYRTSCHICKRQTDD